MMISSDDDVLRQLLGRDIAADYEVVVRNPDNQPVVIRNAPFMRDGTPMPTLYWLVDPQLVREISQLESTGGVTTAQQMIAPADIAQTHERYAAERDATIPTNYEGPRPHGGVGGTRQGVKCLHAHYAYLLAGGDDPIGKWTGEQLEDLREKNS